MSEARPEEQDSTPGPWGMRDTHDNNTEITSALFEDPCHCIANVNARWGWNGDGTDPVQVANARLIASAPALRDALAAAIAHTGTGHHVNCPNWPEGRAICLPLCSQMRAALAAAAPPVEAS